MSEHTTRTWCKKRGVAFSTCALVQFLNQLAHDPFCKQLFILSLGSWASNGIKSNGFQQSELFQQPASNNQMVTMNESNDIMNVRLRTARQKLNSIQLLPRGESNITSFLEVLHDEVDLRVSMGEFKTAKAARHAYRAIEYDWLDL